MRADFDSSAVFVVALLLAGCSSQPPPQQASGENLQTIASAYLQAAEKEGKPPASAADLKPYLPPDADFDKLSISPNDGEPVVILWGADPNKLRDIKPGVIGYEKKGSDGRRFVFTAMGVVVMTDEDFRNAKFPPGHSAPE